MVEFVRLSRDARRRIPFIDSRYVDPGVPRLELPISALPPAATLAAGDCHFIFHSAFCCSTLLGRALEREGVAAVLQEPQILADFSVLLAAAEGGLDRHSELDAVLALMQRPHRPGEVTILKLSNSANSLIEPLLALRPRASAIIMYAPLPLYLLKIALGGTTRRKWVRSTAGLLKRHGQCVASPAPDLSLLTDLEAAAYLWLEQQGHFARLLGGRYAERFAVVEASDLLDAPGPTLRKVWDLFGLHIDDDMLSEIVGGPAFAQEAKVPGEKFDPAARRMNEAAAKFAYGAEIEAALDWAHGFAERAGIPLRLRST